MLRKFLILLMAAFSSTFALRRVERRSSSESEEMNMFHDIIREQLASIYQDLYPMEETENGSENGSMLWDDDHFNGWVRRMILGRPELAPLAYQYYA